MTLTDTKKKDELDDSKNNNNIDQNGNPDGDDGTDDEHEISSPAYLSFEERRLFLRTAIKTLPEDVQKRITVLKNIQVEQLKLEEDFAEEVQKLEQKYFLKFKPLFDKCSDIVSGRIEPTTEKPKWQEISIDDDDIETEPKWSKMLDEYKQIPKDSKGVPHFWLSVFKNIEVLADMVQPHDEPVLQKLQDIKIKNDPEYNFTLEFHFDKNDYFTNAILSKKYFVKPIYSEECQFEFEGYRIYRCEGCEINWDKQKNLTIKTITKRQKHRMRGAVRTITKQVPNESFFNFFSPPDVRYDPIKEQNEIEENDSDDDSQELLETDFEIGDFLRTKVIPKSVLYYTGDIVEENDEDESDDEYDEENDHEAEPENNDKNSTLSPN